MTRGWPTYDLREIQEKVRGGEYLISGEARQGATALCLDETDVLDCVCKLAKKHFYKSMPSKKRPGTWHDVYKPRYCGHPVYVKVQLEDDKAIVISFKEE